MARFYRINIGELYFTETGENGATPCKLEIAGVAGMRLGLAGSTDKSIDGDAVTWLIGDHEDEDLIRFDHQIKISRMRSAVLTDLFELAKASLLADEPVVITGTGASGDFECNAKFIMPDPINFGNFIQDYIKEVVIKITTSISIS